jgi:hypothetical protein
MEVLSVRTGQDWLATSVPEGSTAADSNKAEETKQQTVALLSDVLMADNLVVLSGLGTSLCVKDSAGAIAAPTMADLWTTAKVATKKFAEVLTLARYVSATEGENLERLLSRCHLVQSVDPQPTLASFIDSAERIVVDKCSFVEDATNLPVHEAFIRVMARRSPRKPRLKLFTLNYDLCFEAAASRARFVVIDGFSHTQPQQFDSDYFAYDIVRRDDDRPAPDYIANVFHLYKLHGSVDWGYEGADVVRTEQPKKPVII